MHEHNSQTGEINTGDIPAYDQSRMREASEILLAARRTLTPVRELPPKLRPATLEEAYRLQDDMLIALGEVAGWKVGRPGPHDTPVFTPMVNITVMASGALVAPNYRRLRGVEAEIAFLLGEDLPQRDRAYTRDEVLGAIASCHPALELLESGFFDPSTVERLSLIGDLQMHGGFVYGRPFSGWRHESFGNEAASLLINGQPAVEHGSNPGGSDLIGLLVWLANDAAQRTGGLLAGHWITTGSWTGNTFLKSGDTAEARFREAGSASVTFE